MIGVARTSRRILSAVALAAALRGGMQGAAGVAHACSVDRGSDLLPVPVVIPVAPKPGDAVRADSPQAYIAARLVARVPVARVVLWLDGKEVTPAEVGPDQRHMSLFYQPSRWRSGGHAVRIEAWDGAGAVAHSTWRFRIDSGRPYALQ